MARIFLIIVVLLSASVGGCSDEANKTSSPAIPSAGQNDEYVRKPLKITTQDGRTLFFQVEIADDPQERAKGLMYREDMAPDHGMIFLFSEEQALSFWMRNTFLALDIIFVDKDGIILNIGKGMPLDESGVPSAGPAKAAIELNAGTADKLGISAGDRIDFIGFNN